MNDTPEKKVIIDAQFTDDPVEIIRENLAGMKFLQRAAFDFSKSKELKQQAIDVIKLHVSADMQRMTHAYSLQLSQLQIENHKVYQDNVNSILKEILAQIIKNTSDMLNTLENGIMDGLEQNKATLDRYKSLLSDGTIDEAKFEKNVSRFLTDQETLEANVRDDLVSMIEHQRNNLKLSLENFVGEQIKKHSVKTIT